MTTTRPDPVGRRPGRCRRLGTTPRVCPLGGPRARAASFALAALVLLCGCGARPGETTSSSDTATTSVQASTATIGSVGTATGHLVTVAPPTPTAAPTPLPPPAHGTVTLTDRSTGATVPVSVGTTIEVRLGPSSSPYVWSEVTSANDAVVHRIASALAGGGATATFVAVSAGTAELTAADSPHCTPACGAASILWRVTILVQR